MSYGKNITMNNSVYLIEKFEENVYVAHKNSDDSYTKIFEGSYTELFWGIEISDDLRVLKSLPYDDMLYAILLYCLDSKGIINRSALYQKYIFSLLKDGHTKEDILSSSSDEVIIYENYYPLDVKREDFEMVTSLMIDSYQYVLNNELKYSCPCCRSSQLEKRDSTEDLELFECMDCDIPDFYRSLDGTIHYDGNEYSPIEFRYFIAERKK